MKKALSLLCVIGLSLTMASCHTVSGFGQDLEKLGGKITDKADQ